jgi:hypothetical protein
LQSLTNVIIPIEVLDDTIFQYERKLLGISNSLLENGDVDENILQQMIFQLPKLNLNLFIYLLSFFKNLLSDCDYNNLTGEKIGKHSLYNIFSQSAF